MCSLYKVLVWREGIGFSANVTVNANGLLLLTVCLLFALAYPKQCLLLLTVCLLLLTAQLACKPAHPLRQRLPFVL